MTHTEGRFPFKRYKEEDSFCNRNVTQQEKKNRKTPVIAKSKKRRHEFPMYGQPSPSRGPKAKLIELLLFILDIQFNRYIAARIRSSSSAGS